MGRPLAWLAGLLVTVLAIAAPADARREVSPYIEVQQVLDADLSGGGETLTYTALAAGIDASISNRRLETTVSYRYERRIAWNDDLGDDDVHSGLARARLALVPNLLSLEGGAIAARARSDIRGEAPEIFVGDQSNITQVYGAYAGPTLATDLGALDLTASYRFGYVRVEDKPSIALAPGQPPLDAYDSSTMHSVTASAGMPSGPLPFGWTVSGGYEREDASQLDQRYEAKYLRGDVIVPLTPALAVTTGIGYEDIVSSQRAPLRDANGAPIIDGSGRFVTDPASPRLLGFATDGLIYDAGVIWRPNRRLTLQVRAGRRYGDEAYTGSLDWQISPHAGLQVGVYDAIDSFGRSLTRGVAGLPTGFELPRNPLAGNFGGCVFGTDPGTGGCLDDVFQSIATSNFRSRGMFALYSAERGAWSAGLGGGYAQRKYLAPVEGTFFTINGVKDESWMVHGNVARQLSRVSSIDAVIFADWYKSGIAGAPDVMSAGATSSYYHSFGNRLSANASVGIYAFDQEGFDADVSGTLLIGMRYQF